MNFTYNIAMEDANLDKMVLANSRISKLIGKTQNARNSDDFYVILADYKLHQDLNRFTKMFNITPNYSLKSDQVETYVANSMSKNEEAVYSLEKDEELVVDRFDMFGKTLAALLIEHKISIIWFKQFIDFLVLGSVQDYELNNPLVKVYTDKIKHDLVMRASHHISKKQLLKSVEIAFDEWREKYPKPKRKGRTYAKRDYEIVIHNGSNSKSKTAYEFNMDEENIKQILIRTKKLRKELIEKSWGTGIDIEELKTMGLI